MSETKKNEMPSLEETFKQLEEIINQMEGQEVSLDESFQLYQQGVDKLKTCSNLLDRVEKKLMVLNAEGELEEL